MCTSWREKLDDYVTTSSPKNLRFCEVRAGSVAGKPFALSAELRGLGENPRIYGLTAGSVPINKLSRTARRENPYCAVFYSFCVTHTALLAHVDRTTRPYRSVG